MKGLLESSTTSIMDPTQERVVRLSKLLLFTAGFICKARSRLNNSASANKGCVQRETESTGVSFRETWEYVKQHRPRVVLLENVVALAEPVPDSAMTDAEYIVDRFLELGYACTVLRCDAWSYGSLARRERLYWMAFESNNPEAGAKVQEVLDICATGEPICDLDSYLIDEDCRQSHAKEPKEDAEREFKYKDEHIEAYDEAKLTWPPLRGKWNGSLDHLGQRAYELTVYCDARWPYVPRPTGTHWEYIDANFSMKRLVGPSPTSPWSDAMPTMTGLGQYIARRGVPLAEVGSQNHSIAGNMELAIEMRHLDGIELMQIVGFDLSYMQGRLPESEVATSMAGNAFSAFGIGPLMLGVFRSLTWAGEGGDRDDDDHMTCGSRTSTI